MVILITCLFENPPYLRTSSGNCLLPFSPPRIHSRNGQSQWVKPAGWGWSRKLQPCQHKTTLWKTYESVRILHHNICRFLYSQRLGPSYYLNQCEDWNLWRALAEKAYSWYMKTYHIHTNCEKVNSICI